MSDSLLVVLGDTVAGTLSRLPGGKLRFDYQDDYRQRPDATPLSISMPIRVRSHPDHVVIPWLWGLLPDNEAVLTRWARQFHASAASPFSLLATRIGRDCAGAVRFVPPNEVDQLMDRPGHITWLTDDDVAERLRELRQDSTTWLGRSFTGQFSLAGAQAKTALLLRNGRWGEPSGRTATTHILKPAVAGLDDHDLNEHLCLDAAQRAGLLVVRTHITRFGEETAIVVERYDRQSLGDEVIRIHQEDLCQTLGVPPARKYQNEGGPGPRDIANIFRQTMPYHIATDAIRRFVEALAWNWLIAGTDAHAKNYSLLLAADQVRLAPLYDIASALPYGTHERKLRFAMKLGDDYRVFPHRNRWREVALELDIDADETVARVETLALRAPDAFADAALSHDIVSLKRDLPGRLVDLVADRAARCGQLLRTT